jgi:serine/threonine protein kinase
MLTGRNPFSAVSVTDTVMKIVKHTPVPPSSIASGGPPELDAVTLRALSKDLDSRFQSAASMSAELRNVLLLLDDRAHQRPVDYVLPVDDAADKVPMAVWLTAAAGIAVVVALLWWLGVRT